MFWIYLVFLIIAAVVFFFYGIYHLTVGIRGWKLVREMKRGKGQAKNWTLLTHEAYECGKQGEYWKSIKLAEKALELNPRASEAWRLIGNAYEFLGDEMEQNGKCKEAKDFRIKATQAWNEAKKINPNIIIPGYHE